MVNLNTILKHIGLINPKNGRQTSSVQSLFLPQPTQLILGWFCLNHSNQMKRILLFALLLLVFNVGYSQDNRVQNASLEYTVIMLMSIGIALLAINVYTARKAYKEEEVQKEPPIHITNHFHVCGSTAHAGSTAVNERSNKSNYHEEDNSNKSEVTNTNGSRLNNNMNITPHSSEVGGSQLSDYVEGEDDENVHSYQEGDIDEDDDDIEEEKEETSQQVNRNNTGL